MQKRGSCRRGRRGLWEETCGQQQFPFIAAILLSVIGPILFFPASPRSTTSVPVAMIPPKEIPTSHHHYLTLSDSLPLEKTTPDIHSRLEWLLHGFPPWERKRRRRPPPCLPFAVEILAPKNIRVLTNRLLKGEEEKQQCGVISFLDQGIGYRGRLLNRLNWPKFPFLLLHGTCFLKTWKILPENYAISKE